MPRENSGYLLAPPAKVDRNSVATGTGKHAVNEIKEWQAIMDYIRGLPVKNKGGLPTIPVDERAFGGSGIQNWLIGFGADGAQPKAGTFGANLKRFARAICAAAKSSRSSASHAVRANSSVRQINASRMQSSWKGAFDRTPALPLRRRLPCAIHLQPGGPSLLSLF